VVFDEHIAAAKLKRIENNAELKRANMVNKYNYTGAFFKEEKVTKNKIGSY
jgi:hypothetical protein